ncbi:MAG: efflux RND transporter periplasmic adaptor subunit [Cyclobacteriaceae bacterium]|nr:efflux RND transporter periplasmic adaptor subunit [Cyclobacteriaceae bacterium]
MKKIGYLVIIVLVVIGCEQSTTLEEKKTVYEEAKTELDKQKAKVHALKVELEEAGVLQINDNRSLVTTLELKPSVFEHKIDVRGTVKARGNVTISPEISARVTRVLVKEGEKVKMGQTLVMQDAEVLRNNIAELRTSLELANTIYSRQHKLWNKNIGTEVQYLEAKNKKESLERKLATSKSQLAKSIIKAPFSGVVDRIDVRVGQNIQPGMPIIRLVSLADMYMKADVSESFVGKFRQGQDVSILFPSTGVKLEAKISAIGQVIEPKNRTFELEIIIPSDNKIKPNMVAVISISDYKNKEALIIPTNIIFTDSKGVFVYQLKQADGKNVAIRTDVTLGLTSGINTEVLAGLEGGNVIIDKGIYDISNGSHVKIAE